MIPATDGVSIDSKSQANQASSTSLSQLWAKKYVQNLQNWDEKKIGGRAEFVDRLLQSLRSNSAKAWTNTETLLAQEVLRQGIERDLIDPWGIAKDVHDICETAVWAYTDDVIPQRLSVLAAAEIGKLRHKYTSQDPRVLGFVSMQLYHTREYLLEPLSQAEKFRVSEYFKVIDDLLYMPLQRAYEAAAQYDYEDPKLAVVQKLLPISSEIAYKICEKVREIYPSYQCHHGALTNTQVYISSIRDVEMFQIYLWVCVLEGNIEAIQQELFPLCVMLYPILKVRWELVQEMIQLLGAEIRFHLKEEEEAFFTPYFKALMDMFSPEVFPESPLSYD